MTMIYKTQYLKRFKEIVSERGSGLETPAPVQTNKKRYCMLCRSEADTDYCQKCKEPALKGYMSSSLPGRIGKNNHSGNTGGTIHARLINGRVISYKSLCGYEPGRKAYGWFDVPEKLVTCPRCLKKIQRMNNYGK